MSTIQHCFQFLTHSHNSIPDQTAPSTFFSTTTPLSSLQQQYQHQQTIQQVQPPSLVQATFPTSPESIPTQSTLSRSLWSKLFPWASNPNWASTRDVMGDQTWTCAKPYVIGCGASMYAQFFFMPFQNIKVFQQSLDRADYKKSNRARLLFNYFRSFGIFNLWRGFPAAFQGQFASTFTHLHFLRQTHDEPTPLSYHEAFATSFLAVALATFAFAPFDLVTTRQQADPLLPHQIQHQYRSIYSAFPKIISTEGPLALYKGFNFSLTRNLAHTTTLLTLFPLLTAQFQQRNTAVDSFCYVAVAIASALIFHPLDSLKVVTQIAPTPQALKTIDPAITNLGPIRSHIQRNGFFSLYRGICMNTAVTVGFPIMTYLIVDLLARSKILK